MLEIIVIRTMTGLTEYCVVSQLRLSCLPRPPVYVEARKLSAVDLTIFKADLRAKLLASPQLSADQLQHLLKELLDQHAPASRHKVSNRPPSSWFSSVGPSFLRRSVNDGQLKDSGSSRDCSFTDRYFVLPTNLSTILCIKPKYLSTAPKFLQAIHPGSFSA